MGAPVCLPDYDERDYLEQTWCGGKPFGPHIGVFWRRQPIHEIREYMGEEVAIRVRVRVMRSENTWGRK